MSGDHGWTHAMCVRCWLERFPNRQPYRMREPEVEFCCYCGGATGDGIYVRDDPSEVHR